MFKMKIKTLLPVLFLSLVAISLVQGAIAAVALTSLEANTREIGAQNIEGPEFYECDFYYVVFFEDPAGNRLELCHRFQN